MDQRVMRSARYAAGIALMGPDLASPQSCVSAFTAEIGI